MTEDARTLAEARLTAALRERQLADPREAYRARLRAVREANPALYDRASRHYQERVLPVLAEAEDPVAVWVEYGQFLADLLSPGRLVAVDGSGRAQPYAAPPAGDVLVLHLPEDSRTPALVLSCPERPTPSQEATCDLLVLGRDALRN